MALDFSGSDIYGNVGGVAGGALHVRIAATSATTPSPETLDTPLLWPPVLRLTGGTFINNTCVGEGCDGGALSLAVAAAAAVSGSAAVAEQGLTVLVLEGVVLHANFAARDGGAVHLAGAAGLTPFELTGVDMSNNRAVRAGGALSIGPGVAATLRGSSIAGNVAALGGGVAAGRAARLWVESTAVELNTASGFGGGLHLDSCSDVVIAGGVVLSGNTASAGGGVYAVGDRDRGMDTAVLMVNVTMANNTITADLAASASSSLASIREELGHGGALLLGYGTSVAMVACDLVSGNDATSGSAVASLQRCRPTATPANTTAPVQGGGSARWPAGVLAGPGTTQVGAVEDWSARWLDAMHSLQQQQGCDVLMMRDVELADRVSWGMD